MRPIAEWCMCITVYGEAQEHGQLLLGVEDRQKARCDAVRFYLLTRAGLI
jgi:hypothetical protein